MLYPQAQITTPSIPVVRLVHHVAIFLLLCWWTAWQNGRVEARDVPMKKAIPPLMDPIPTLPEITDRVFLDVTIDGGKPQQIVVGLFGTIAPKTVENFKALILCTHGIGPLTKKPLCYQGNKFHRIIPNFMIQGGDFTHEDGTGGESIYGGRFADEAFTVRFNRPFMLAMSNSGRDSNGSQFFITTVKAQWLDGKHVVFGMVLEGKDFVHDIEQAGTYGGRPSSDVVIVNCGIHPLKPEDKETHY